MLDSGHWGPAAPACSKSLVSETEVFMDRLMDKLTDSTNQPKWLDIGEYIENTYSEQDFLGKLKSHAQPFGTLFSVVCA